MQKPIKHRANLIVSSFKSQPNPTYSTGDGASIATGKSPRLLSFAASKELALKYLDACPVEVIRRFINRSWRFMSAYRKGLTGKAAEWAVRPQKQHRAISSGALAAIEAVADA
jgi:hypothetical protein